MKWLTREEDFSEMMAAEMAILFVFVDWSEYARRGKDLFEKAESLTADVPLTNISWWIVDASSVASPLSSTVHRWLVAQNSRGRVPLFPNVGMGNGSVVWSQRGDVIGFEPSARRSSPESLIRTTQRLFGEVRNGDSYGT